MESDNHVFVGHRHEWGGDIPFGIDVAARRQHAYVIGQTGAGKSTLLRNLILQDIEDGRGVGIIDPHGDLALDILDHIPANRTREVVYFDPAARKPPPVNLFRTASHDNWHMVASGIVSAFKKIWADSWGPRLEYVLYATVAALVQCPGTSLLGISRMLNDERYRAWVVKHVKDPMVRSFWVDEFAKYDRGFRQEVIAPIQNKAGAIFLAPALRNVLGQTRAKIDFRFMMDRKRIFVANLNKGRIGETHSSLLGALLVTAFELAALSRSDIPAKDRKDFFLFVDEFQLCATDSFATILSEARKYRLSLTLAHQYLGQVPDKLREAVFGNVGTFLSFRTSEADEAVLQRQFGNGFPSSQFSSLENYELCVRLLNKEPFLAKSLPPLETPRRRRRVNIRHASRHMYGRRRKVIEGKIERWLKRQH